LSKGRAEALKVGLEEAYISTHHPEVRDLLALHPEIDSLRADTQELSSLADCPRIFVIKMKIGVGTLHNQAIVGCPIVYASCRVVCTIGIRSS
jgi:hypothetical protein